MFSVLSIDWKCSLYLYVTLFFTAWGCMLTVSVLACLHDIYMHSLIKPHPHYPLLPLSCLWSSVSSSQFAQCCSRLDWWIPGLLDGLLTSFPSWQSSQLWLLESSSSNAMFMLHLPRVPWSHLSPLLSLKTLPSSAVLSLANAHHGFFIACYCSPVHPWPPPSDWFLIGSQ